MIWLRNWFWLRRAPGALALGWGDLVLIEWGNWRGSQW